MTEPATETDQAPRTPKAGEPGSRNVWRANQRHPRRLLPFSRRRGTEYNAPWQPRPRPVCASRRQALSVVLAISAAAAAAASANAPASEPSDSDIARELVEAGRILPLEQLLMRARRLRSGVLVAVELEYEAEHRAYVYEIELLDPAGRVWEVELDAASGDLIELERED